MRLWEGDDPGWDGWMASLTQWTWVWVNSGSWWWTGRPGVLRFMGSQRVWQDWATELNWYMRVICKGELPDQVLLYLWGLMPRFSCRIDFHVEKRLRCELCWCNKHPWNQCLNTVKVYHSVTSEPTTPMSAFFHACMIWNMWYPGLLQNRKLKPKGLVDCL